MNVVYISLLVATVASYVLLVPVVFEAKNHRKKSSAVATGEKKIQFSKISSKFKFRFRLFLLIGLIDVVVLFVTR